MEKYSKAVSEGYPQFKQRETHPMEKYIGRRAAYLSRVLEVVGYTTWPDGLGSLIVDASKGGGWGCISDEDVIIKKCEGYMYVCISDLID